MNISIDIDGTTTKPYSSLKYLNEYFNKNVTVDEFNDNDVKELFGLNTEVFLYGDKSFKDGLWNSVEIREEAPEIIRMLSKEHYCSFVTARSDTPYLRDITERFLKEHKLDKLNLYMLSSHNKLSKAIELKTDVFIEDRGENAIQLAEAGFTVILMTTKYNENFKHPNIYHKKDWFDVFDFINNF